MLKISRASTVNVDVPPATAWVKPMPHMTDKGEKVAAGAMYKTHGELMICHRHAKLQSYTFW